LKTVGRRQNTDQGGRGAWRAGHFEKRGAAGGPGLTEAEGIGGMGGERDEGRKNTFVPLLSLVKRGGGSLPGILE